MINKLFLFNPYPCCVTDGGPSGVIAQNMLGHALPHVDLNPVVGNRLTLRDAMHKRFFPPAIPSFYRDWYFRCRKIYRDFGVARYRAVFFNDVFSLRCCFNLVAPSQKVVLQSHSPELPHQEVAASNFATDELVAWVREIERAAFARADHVVFPNPGAAELYRSVLCDPSKVLYLTTGARRIADAAGISLDPASCHLLFIGRRNSIKGFDLVLDAFSHAHRARPDLKLLLLGRGESVAEPGCIDLGFSEKPHLWMRSCDYLINFNRQSYLDLSVLEALSVGTRIVMSTTDGHREFRGLVSDGIIAADEPTVESLARILIAEDLVHARQSPSLENIDLYGNRYSDEIYRGKLDELANEILSGVP